MGGQVNYSGLVVAGVGFFLTRFTVTLALYEEPLRFYLAGVVPLALGLGLAAFGVALAVADVDSALVRTTARWCVVGAATMLVLVVLTLLGSADGTGLDPATIRSQAYLSNFLIGGSVGGTLTGLYAARTRRQRTALRQQASRLATLNRLLRHEVLNAVTAIRGYASLRTDGSQRTGGLDVEGVIEESARDIERAIEEVKYLTDSGRTAGASTTGVDLRSCLAESVETIRERYPAADCSVPDLPEAVAVRANERLVHVFVHLLENAVVHSGDPSSVDLSVTTTPTRVRVTVTDDGPGLPENQRSLLETGDIEEYDDPNTGFGLNIVRLLVESYGGSIETAVDDGTAITVVLARADAHGDGVGFRRSSTGLAGVRPATPHLLVTMVAALVAGGFYGLTSELLGGGIGGIGVFYGVENVVVGWLTHEFHSVVFGFVFAGLLSLAPPRYRDHVPAAVAIGVGWGLVLWVGAAGVVAPLWLQLLGIPAPLPSLSAELLATHLVWGVSLGALTAWGYRYVAPALSRVEWPLEGRDDRNRG